MNKEINDQLSDVLAYLHEIKSTIKGLEERVVRHADVYESYCTAALYGALSLAQGQYPVIGMNRKDSYWNNEYADLDTILHAVRPMLSENKLAVVQQLKMNDQGMTILHTKLTHGSGEWIESRTRIVPPRDDAETYTSLLNHQKRNAVMALLGITLVNDKYDDNGDFALRENRKYIEKGTAITYKEKDEANERITKEQLEELEYELSAYPDLAEQLFKTRRIESLADLPKSQYMATVIKIREIKSLRGKK